MSKTTRLGDMLLEAELIDKFQLESGLSFQRNVGGRIGSALVKLGYIAEETILQFLDEQNNVTRVDLKTLQIPPDALNAIPLSKLHELMVVPVEWQQHGKNRTLVVAMTDPTNQKLIDDLQFMAGGPIQVVVAPELEIESALKRHFPGGRPAVPPPRPEKQPPLENVVIPHGPRSNSSKVEARLDRVIALLLRKGLITDRDVDSL